MDKLTPERRSANMRQIRSTNTAPEMVVRRIVHGLGYRYRLHVAALPGKPDLVFARLKKIIEVKGCFWHQHAGCAEGRLPRTRLHYWEPKLARNCQRDAENLAKLKSLGWKVLIFWECQISDRRKVQNRIEKFLR